MVGQRAREAFERAKEWEERGNSSKAINALRQAIAIEPDWLEPQRHLAALFLDLGRYDEAIATYRQLQPLASDDDRSIDDIILALENIERGELNPASYRYYVQARDLPDDMLDEKMTLCQQALKLNPFYAAPYSIIGRILLAKGEPNQARAVLERGLACNPSPYIRAVFLFYLGNALLISGQRDQALDFFRRTVALNANRTFTRFANMQLEAAAAGRI